MTLTVQSRSLLWGGRLPSNVDGSPRPLLAPDRPYYTIHYTGTTSNYSDPGDTPMELRNLQTWALSAKKPWEYNYVVDNEGVVWTYAGEYRAAHSAGNNTVAYGILLLLQIGVRPSDAMVNAVRRLRLELQVDGKLAKTHQMLPHRLMPNANTTCPGTAIMSRWPDLITPWKLDKPCKCPPEQAVWDPKAGKFGLWPVNPNKPDVRRGSTGDAVRYLQGVILHKAGGNIVVDGQFGPQTEGRVKDLQRLFGLTVDGWVGRQTWGTVDYLATH